MVEYQALEESPRGLLASKAGKGRCQVTGEIVGVSGGICSWEGPA